MTEVDEEKELRRKLLSRIYSAKFMDRGNDKSLIPLRPSEIMESAKIDQMIAKMSADGLVKRPREGERLEITEKGRKEIVVVMTGGSFDIIHPGHVETLESARLLGDVLIVSVARNPTFIKNKKRPPLHDEKLRKRLVESLRCVDAAILGSENDIYETVELLEPDLIALGYDQAHNEESMKLELKRRGLKSKIVRLESTVPDIKSSNIMREFY